MSKNPIKPALINIYEDPGLQYLNQKPEPLNIPGITVTSSSVTPTYEQITQLITNVINVAMPNGANSEVQFNDNGELSGDNGFTYDPTSDTLNVTHIISNSITLGDVTSTHINGGNNGDVLTTDGTGNLSFNPIFPSVSGNSGKVLKTDGITQVWGNVNYNDIANTPSFATQSYVNNAISDLINGAPAALNTLNELATALGNNASYASTITTALSSKAASADLSDVAFSGSYNDLTDTPTIPSLAGLATETFVTSKGYINSSSLATTLTNYATQTYVGNQGFITAATLTNGGYITSSALTGYALSTDIPTDINQLSDADGLLSQSGSADRLSSNGFEVVLGSDGNLTAGNINIGNLALIDVPEGAVITSNNSSDIDMFTNGGVDDFSEIWLHHGASVEITTLGNTYSWNYTIDGNLVLPQYTSSPAPGTSGIVFSDGTLQVSAAATDINQLNDIDGLLNTTGVTSYNDLTDKPTLFSGSYVDLTNKPTLFSGSYVDLTNKPSIPSSLSDFGITAGSDGQVLTLNSSLIPVWTTPSSGGGNPFDQDLNTTNNATFNSVETSYISAVSDMEIVTVNESAAGIDLYTDWTGHGVEVWLQHNDRVSIKTENGVYEWSFNNVGNLVLPQADMSASPAPVLSGIVFSDGTFQNTAATTGSTFNQSLNTTDTPSFSGITINGNVDYSNGVIQRSGGFVTCSPNMDTVVYTGLDSFQTLKLLFNIEGVEDGQTVTDTQSCEMIVAKALRGNTVSGSAYGLVYTSTNPLVTLSTRWNSTINRVEILCRPTSTVNSVSVLSTCTEIYSASLY